MVEMSPPPVPPARPSRFTPTSGWRVVLPALATTLAVFLLLLAFVGFNFHQRLDGYVQVEGTVQNAMSGAEVGLDLTAAEVRYEIDGNEHVGVLAVDRDSGDLSEGDSVRVMAPGDGSPFSILRFPASGATQALGWICFVIGFAATVAGTIWLVRATLGRNRALRHQTWSELGGPVRPAAATAYGPGPGWVAPGPPDTGVPLGSVGPGLSTPPSYDEAPAAEPTEPAEAPTDPGLDVTPEAAAEAAEAADASDASDQPGEDPDRPPPTRGS